MYKCNIRIIIMIATWNLISHQSPIPFIFIILFCNSSTGDSISIASVMGEATELPWQDLIAQTNYVDENGEVLGVKQYAAAPHFPNN